jgi:hypothetical protein
MKSRRKTKPIQYTVRGVPSRLDRNLRKRAHESGKSFNQVALEALASGCGEKWEGHDDLDFLIGSMNESDARHMEEQVKGQRQIEEKLWK